MTSPRHYFWLVAKSELEPHFSALSALAIAQFMSWFPLAEILQQGPILTPCHSLPLHLPTHESPWISLSTNSIWTFLLMATLEGPPPHKVLSIQLKQFHTTFKVLRITYATNSFPTSTLPMPRPSSFLSCTQTTGFFTWSFTPLLGCLLFSGSSLHCQGQKSLLPHPFDQSRVLPSCSCVFLLWQ